MLFVGKYTTGVRRVPNHPPSEDHHDHGIFTLTGSSPYISIVLEAHFEVLFVGSTHNRGSEGP